MSTTFADQLKLFALSTDVVDESRFNRVYKLIQEYCLETLEIEFTKLYQASKIDGDPALTRYRLNSTANENIRSVKINKKYTGQIALAFGERKPLWIISPSRSQKLVSARSYIDQWSGVKSIPAFQTSGDPSEESISTSIVVPIYNQGDDLGVLCFETTQCLEITEEAKSELHKIAQTVGMLFRLRRAVDTQRKTTIEAIDNLQKILTSPLPKLTKPKIFLASSSKAEADVIESVLEILKNKTYAQKLDLIYWKEMADPGNINSKLLKEIATCRYGICYFSEKSEDETYIDNVNVVFEAGMFHGRVDEIKSQPASWIPIRERNSPSLPFDFAQERILWVERNGKGGIKKPSFQKQLKYILDAMLAE